MNPQSQGLMRAITGPVIMITVGVLFLIDRITGVGFGQTWPVLLIVIGILKLLGGRGLRRIGPYYTAPYAAPPASQYAPPEPPPPPAPGERR